MSKNDKFLTVLKTAFIKCMQTNERSNEKLKILHPCITKDLCDLLGTEEYSFYSLGYNDGKEVCIQGRYMNKKVDITIKDKQTGEDVGGIAVKFVMSNYSQNSNNYFENMLGETSNIRSNNIPYFQIFCIFDTLPYFDKQGNITKWEQITKHNIDKYLKLSDDNINYYYHTPNKTLLYIIHIEPDVEEKITTKDKYKKYYLKNKFDIVCSDLEFSFGNTVIYNDYEKFLRKVVYTIQSR